MKRIDDFRGQPSVQLLTPAGDRATVLLHGAQVVSWIPAGGTERLYLSERSAYGEGSSVRGGVPVIFPQFNQRGPDFNVPRHGFARTRSWRVEQADDKDSRGDSNDGAEATAVTDATEATEATEAKTRLATTASVRLALADDAATRALWPHPFSLALTVTLGLQQLDLALRVRNTGLQPFAFTAALHTYFNVADISQASVSGLEDVRYLDTVTNLDGVGASHPLRFDRETDNIYFDVPRPLSLSTPNGPVQVSMQGFHDAVIWNPWVDLCASLPDMPADGYRQMLCIEAAAIGRPVTLAKDEHWLGRQTLNL